MADEAKGKEGELENTPKEGSVEEIVTKAPTEEVVVDETKKESQTVPLSVYLDLKNDVKVLKKKVEDSEKVEKSSVVAEGVEDLAKKYPDVSKDFINDILLSATSKASKEIDEKYTPALKKIEAEKAQVAFDKEFDKIYDKALADNQDLPKNVDKDVVKALALTPAYRNTPISEILTKLYGVVETGKSTTENDTRSAGDTGEEVIDFSKMNTEQRDKVLEDPAARKKYFAFLDSQ